VVAFDAVAARVFGAELPSVERVSVEQVEDAAAPTPARDEASSGTRR
jgi:hypothetical protein